MTTTTTPPVLLIIFNRPDLTKKVFQSIRAAKPNNLYIASDAPRENIAGENDKVFKLRAEILKSIDWKCEIKTLFHTINQGCKYGPQKAITWFFENERNGIILEDDCLPSSSFYRYAKELLNLYENDYRIFGVSGTNFQSEKFNINHSYYYSNFFMTWGWATWKSRWEKHLEILNNYSEYFSDPDVYHLIKNKSASKSLISFAEKGFYDKLDAWDYQWILSCMIHRGLIATPSKNLIQNIGFGEGATHTTSANNRDIPALDLKFPLVHPTIIRPNEEIDNSFYKNIQGWLSTSEKIMDSGYLIALFKARISHYNPIIKKKTSS